MSKDTKRVFVPLLTVILFLLSIVLLKYVGSSRGIDKEIVDFCISCSMIFSLVVLVISALISGALIDIEEKYIEWLIEHRSSKKK